LAQEALQKHCHGQEALINTHSLVIHKIRVETDFADIKENLEETLGANCVKKVVRSFIRQAIPSRQSESTLLPRILSPRF